MDDTYEELWANWAATSSPMEVWAAEYWVTHPTLPNVFGDLAASGVPVYLSTDERGYEAGDQTYGAFCNGGVNLRVMDDDTYYSLAIEHMKAGAGLGLYGRLGYFGSSNLTNYGQLYNDDLRIFIIDDPIVSRMSQVLAYRWGWMNNNTSKGYAYDGCP